MLHPARLYPSVKKKIKTLKHYLTVKPMKKSERKRVKDIYEKVFLDE